MATIATRAKVLWNRMPTYFPNIKLVLVPLSEESVVQVTKTGHLPEVRRSLNPVAPMCL